MHGVDQPHIIMILADKGCVLDAHTGPAPVSASGDAVVTDSDSDSDSTEHIMRHAIAHDAMKQQLDVASAALGWTLPGSVTNLCGGGTITDTGATFTARYNVCSSCIVCTC